MQRRHALSLLASSIAASLALSLPAVAAPTESQRFHRWLDAEWALKLKQDPLLATSLGDPRYNARFVDTTTAAWRAQAKKDTRRQLRQLAGFRKDRLEPSDQVSYSILKLELEQELAGGAFSPLMQPINPNGGPPRL